ncbi:MAG: hypothetical protein QXF28_06195 [Nitrososphaerota archaeon]
MRNVNVTKFSIGYVRGRLKARYRRYAETIRTMRHNDLTSILKNLGERVLILNHLLFHQIFILLNFNRPIMIKVKPLLY